MKILVLNGPNINMLGIREPEIYGAKSYKDLLEAISAHAQAKDVTVEFYQSNHEGDLVDAIQKAYFPALTASCLTPRRTRTPRSQFWTRSRAWGYRPWRCTSPKCPSARISAK